MRGRGYDESMNAHRPLRLVICAALLAGATQAAMATDLSPADVTKSLQAIETNAQAIASGRDKKQIDLRDAARTIGVEWDKIEPVVSQQYLVEAKFANESIATFERDWQNSNKARTEAKDVSDKVAQLLDAQKEQ
jgi:hypothetical protein